jgi:hypothetical protein
MKRALASIAIISLALFCCKPKEANWVLIKEDPSAKVFVDQGSIKHVSGNVVRAWVKFEFIQPIEVDSKGAQRMVSHEEFDCIKKTRQTLQCTFYFIDQTEDSSSEKGTIDTIAAGTYAEFEYKYICK